MGLDIYLEWRGQTKADHDAQIAAKPGEGGEVGYLRSSYNDGGFNAWARRTLGVEGFYHIFGCTFQDVPYCPVMGEDGQPYRQAFWWSERGLDGEEGTDWDYAEGFFPDWPASRERAHALLQRAEQLDYLYLLRVSSPVTPNGRKHLRLEEVLDAYREGVAEVAQMRRERLERVRAEHGAEAAERAAEWESGGWGNWQGDWMPHDSPTVRAVLWTRHDGFFRSGLEPVLVCESEENPHAWYIRAIADCLCFIDTGEKREAWVRWSS